MFYRKARRGRFKELPDRGLNAEEAILEAIRGEFGTSC